MVVLVRAGLAAGLLPDGGARQEVVGHVLILHSHSTARRNPIKPIVVGKPVEALHELSTGRTRRCVKQHSGLAQFTRCVTLTT